MTASRRGPSGRRLSPSLVAVIGLATTAICLVLLFAPLHVNGTPLINPLRYSVASHLETFLPGQAAWTIDRRFPPIVVIILLLALVILPYRRAAARATEPDPEPATAVTVMNDGRILGDDGRTSGGLDRTIPQLRLLAASAGIPWRETFETPGGARALLDLYVYREQRPANERPAAPDLRDMPVPLPGTAGTPSLPAAPVPAEEPDLGSPAGFTSSIDAVYTPTDLYTGNYNYGDDEHDDEQAER